MGLQVRRVITGHDTNGRAVVKIDELSKLVFTGRLGATVSNVWTPGVASSYLHDAWVARAHDISEEA